MFEKKLLPAVFVIVRYRGVLRGGLRYTAESIARGLERGCHYGKEKDL